MALKRLIYTRFSISPRIWSFSNNFQHIFFKIIQLLLYLAIFDELRAGCHAGPRRLIFHPKLEALRHKMFHISHFLSSDMVSEIVNPIPSIFNATSSEHETLANFNAIPVNLHLRQDNKGFLAFMLNHNWSIQILGVLLTLDMQGSKPPFKPSLKKNIVFQANSAILIFLLISG